MPKNKDALTRYRTIDQYLRRTKFAKTSRLAEVCGERLGIPVSVRTIQKDILDMREDTALGFYAPIIEDKKRQGYYYPEDVDNLFPAIELDSDEISALLFYGQIQSQYNQLGIFGAITEAIDKVLDAANVRQEYREVVANQPIIQMERTPRIKGNELLIKLIQALRLKKKIRFSYQKFGEEKKERVISPYILKEDKHMWYLIGNIDGRDHVTTFAVDRMSDIRIQRERIKKSPFSPRNYFKYSFGVTVTDDEPINVVLSFTRMQGHYLKTLPIHETQKILVDNEDELRISIQVKPAYEFYSKILSYGDSVKIISPEGVQQEVKETLRKALLRYEN
jgi:predicted DNA-binding transcriptional regulator YafY